MPNIKCVSNIKGSENIDQATAFFESEEEKFEMNSSIVDKLSSKYWRLSQNSIREIEKWSG